MDPDDAQPIDMVAWHMAQPSRWWLRRGAGVLLGEIEVEHAVTYGEPLRVHRTPLGWLRAAGEGVVILDWGAAWFYLRDLRLAAEDHDHPAELQRRLQPPCSPGPRIGLMVPMQRWAA